MNATALPAARRLAVVLGIGAVLGLFNFPPAPVQAGSQPILIDGDLSEWAGPPLATDATGDAGFSGIDFVTLHLANDPERLFLRFDTTVEVQPDEQQGITVALDTDNDSETGESVGSIGAELVWNLGARSGTFHVNGNQYGIGHADVGLFVGPTVSATEFEIAFDRAAIPAAGEPLFPGSIVRAVLFDDIGGGDVLDAGATSYTFDETPQPVPPIALGRDAPGHVRIAGYNVLSDGLFSGGSRGAAFDRLFDAVDPDVWVLCEIWSYNGPETRDRVEAYLPSGAGESWYAVKLDGGNVIVSRFPILDSWVILSGSRLTAALLDARPQLDSDLLLIANHWSCCAADDNRQEQADALISFLRDARTPGGRLDLVTDTPIVAAGDFNLVGWRGALDTTLEGDIFDNGTFGPDSPPDWDGSMFDAANPRHPDARLGATWWNDGSSFYPGRLDWIFYSGSVLELHNHYVLETRSMTPASLAAAGLQATDSEVASDHAPVVADFFAPTAPPVSTPGPDAASSRLRLDRPAPSPFGRAARTTEIPWSLPRAGHVRLSVHDVAGRVVRVLEDGSFGPGAYTSHWNGRGRDDALAPSGIYFLRLELAGEGVRGRRVVLSR